MIRFLYLHRHHSVKVAHEEATLEQQSDIALWAQKTWSFSYYHLPQHFPIVWRYVIGSFKKPQIVEIIGQSQMLKAESEVLTIKCSA